MCGEFISYYFDEFIFEFRNSCWILVEFYGSSKYSIMYSANSDSLSSSFPICILLISLVCLIALASVSRMMLNRSAFSFSSIRNDVVGGISIDNPNTFEECSYYSISSSWYRIICPDVSILANLHWHVDNDEPTMMGGHWQIYTGKCISMNLHWHINISGSTLKGQYWGAYPKRQLSINISWWVYICEWVNINWCLHMDQYLCIYPFRSIMKNLPNVSISMKLPWEINIDVSTLKDQYVRIWSNRSKSIKLRQWVNADKSTPSRWYE